jgi:hypothetical protein
LIFPEVIAKGFRKCCISIEMAGRAREESGILMNMSRWEL